MHGTVARPISFAAMTRPWPAIIPPLESIKMGLVKPNSVMLATICVTWAGECVRAFFAYGISALTGRCSMAEATIGPVFNLI